MGRAVWHNVFWQLLSKSTFLILRRAKITPVLCRRLPGALFKVRDKIAGIKKTARLCNFRNGLIGCAKKGFRTIDSISGQITVWRNAHNTLEQADKVIF